MAIDLSQVATKIQSVFSATASGIDATTKKMEELQNKLIEISQIKIGDVNEFAKSLEKIAQTERELAVSSAKLAKAQTDLIVAEQQLMNINAKIDGSGRKRANTIEDLIASTKNYIARKKVEQEAIRTVAYEIDGEVGHTRALLKEKENLARATKEMTSLLNAESAADANRSRTIEEIAQKYQIYGNSIKELNAQNAALREITASSSITKDTEALEKYNTIINANSFLVKANSDAAIQLKMNIGNYTSTLEGGVQVEKTQLQALTELQEKYMSLQQYLGGLGSDALQQEDSFDPAEFKQAENELYEVAKQIEELSKQVSGNMGKAEGSVVSFRQRMREVREEVLSLKSKQANGIVLSDEELKRLREAEKELAKMTDLMGDVNTEAKTLASDTLPFDQVAGVLQVGTAAVQSYKSAMELLGLNQQGYEKTMRTFIALQSMINGLNVVSKQLQDGETISIILKNAALSKNIVISKIATITQKALNKAISASPYIALAAAIVILVKHLAEYIWEVTEAGKASQKATKQLEALQGISEEVADSFTEAAVKITNYGIVLKSSTASDKAKQKALEGLNIELEDQGIKLESVTEATEWYNKEGKDFILTLQKQAIAVALFSMQTDKIKDSLKKVDETLEDLKETTIWENLGNTILKSLSFQKYAESDIDGVINYVKKQITLLQEEVKKGNKSISIAKDFFNVENLPKDMREIIPFVNDYLIEITKKGKIANIELEKLDVNWLMQAIRMGAVSKTTKDFGTEFEGLLSEMAEYLVFTDKATVKNEKMAQSLKMLKEDVSMLYELWRSELVTIEEHLQYFIDEGIVEYISAADGELIKKGFSKLFDFNLFEQLSGQIKENFESIQGEYTNFSDETSDFYSQLIKVEGLYSEYVANLSEENNITLLKKTKELQEETLKLYTKGQADLLKKQTENRERLLLIEEEYSKAKTNEEKNALVSEQAAIQKEQTSIRKSLTDIEKLRKQHFATINELQEKQSDKYIKLLEKQQIREQKTIERGNESELADFELKYGVLYRLLGNYEEKRSDIIEQHQFAEIDRQKVELESAISINAQKLKEAEETYKKLQELGTKTANNQALVVEGVIEALKTEGNSLSDAMQDLLDKLEVLLNANEKRIQEAKAAFVKQMLSEIQEFASAISSILDIINQNEIDLLDQRLERLNIWRDAQQESIDNTIYSEEEKVARQKALDREYANSQYQIELAKWQLEVENFKRNQAAKVSEIGMEVALGIMKAWAEYGSIPIFGQAYAGVITGILAGIGVAQTAAVLLQEPPLKPLPPAYAEGTDFHQGGYAIVGDAGKHEVIETKEGKRFLTPATATLMEISRGAKVYKDYDDFLKNSNETTSVMNFKDNSDIVSAIEKNKASMSLYFDRNGIYKVAADGLYQNSYICNVLKLKK